MYGESKRLKPDWRWLKEKLVELLKTADKISKIEPEVFYPAHSLTPLKLTSLMYYLDVYTKVFSKFSWCKEMVYIDLLADSGLNRLKKSGKVFVGSPLIAAEFAHRPFDKFLLVEKNANHAKVLEERLNDIGIRPDVFPKDCNEAISEIIRRIRGSASNYLAFIDNEGLDVNWETMEKLLKLPGDIIFNFPTKQIERCLGKYKGDKSDEKAFNNFFGDETWKTSNNAHELLTIYMDKLKENSRELVESINIKSTKGGQFNYHLIFATRKTKAGSPYFEVVHKLRERIEKTHGGLVDKALEILTGDSTDLEAFL